MFVVNYQRSTSEFYYSEYHTFSYGPGFGLTIGAGLCLLGSGGLGCSLFCGIVMSLFKKGLNTHYAEVQSAVKICISFIPQHVKHVFMPYLLLKSIIPHCYLIKNHN